MLINNSYCFRLMAFYIEKNVCKVKNVYYKGNDQWTDTFEDRKVYLTKEDAQEERTRFSGTIESD